VRGVEVLGVPLIVTEQYPKGLGSTTTEVRTLMGRQVEVVEKRSMSCWGAQPFRDRLDALGRRQVLVAGIETHACVNQTVHDLLAAGYEAHVARDATSSRRAADVGPAWEKMQLAGMRPTSSEQALLELVRSADAPEFKILQRLLKETLIPPAGV
jgi:nicotinamidase-related amidase